LLGVATAPASARAERAGAATVTTINVTAGNPSELAFKFSKISNLPTGTIVFNVKNVGKVVHDFKICTVPTSTALDTCTGKGTKRIKPGKSAKLTFNFKFEGKYEFLCTVPGHASAGMKGLLGIGVKVANVAVTTKPVSSGGGASNPAATAKPCANPVSTTITVDEFDFGFRLSPSTAPCGTITFRQSNSGQAVHDFVIPGVARGDRINPGQTTSMTATVGPGGFQYLCTVEGHDTLGMVGTLNVT
jgi:uncharacterized cupredoxin-like copper-binding protein